MKTITAPNGKQYEVEEGWEDLYELNNDHIPLVVLFDDGRIRTLQLSLMAHNDKSTPIAWRPIVPPKEKRWRAEEGGKYWYVDDDGQSEYDTDPRYDVDDARYSIGNYFRSREEAEASNKAKVMRDPESER